LESSRDSLNVLDIGFGLGYNILALVSEAKNRNLKKNINIISLEKERELLPFMEEIFFDDYRDEFIFL
jgi:protein-L-isoaspartate O-methyltransferase